MNWVIVVKLPWKYSRAVPHCPIEERPLAPVADPVLAEAVDRLIAEEADACPVCSKELPLGRLPILCPTCGAERTQAWFQSVLARAGELVNFIPFGEPSC